MWALIKTTSLAPRSFEMSRLIRGHHINAVFHQTRFGMVTNTISNLDTSRAYRLVTAWLGDSNAHEQRRRQRMADITRPFTGTDLPAIHGIYRRRYLQKATNMIKVLHHRGHALILLPPPGRSTEAWKLWSPGLITASNAQQLGHCTTLTTATRIVFAESLQTVDLYYYGLL